jgi:mRNA interferase MazF
MHRHWLPHRQAIHEQETAKDLQTKVRRNGPCPCGSGKKFRRHPSVTVLLITSSPVDASMLRVPVQPGGTSGVQLASQVMIDKTMTLRRDKLGQVVGSLGDTVMVEVERRLAIFLSIAK